MSVKSLTLAAVLVRYQSNRTSWPLGGGISWHFGSNANVNPLPRFSERVKTSKQKNFFGRPIFVWRVFLSNVITALLKHYTTAKLYFSCVHKPRIDLGFLWPHIRDYGGQSSLKVIIVFLHPTSNMNAYIVYTYSKKILLVARVIKVLFISILVWKKQWIVN